MSKIMLINVTHAEESRVGIVENGQLESFEIESLSREHLKGNIYKGIVRRIHPAIEAAFVDIGAERDAFLPLDEICFRNLPTARNGATSDKSRRRIKDVLKSGDEVLVQIIKEQFTNKPPTLSTFYSLPGRYLVLLPGSEDAGISRKIEGDERVRVREMIESLNPPAGCGIIVRTAAGFDEERGELERDLAYLQRLWESIRKHSESKRAPALVYREHDLVLRNIRDYFTPDINEIFVDNEEVYERAQDFLHNVMPGKEHLLHLYQGEQPIFSRFGLETQIESIYKRRVQLKSGGSIVIDGTEALTAIDVNSGGSMRGASQEETAYKTNLEAANEIARQLRLRDLGGIIVIDFIDMRIMSHVSDVERALREAMRPDKARHDIGRISRLGLLEISRQRLRPAAAASSYTACPMCEGHGAIRTTESAALVALRKIHHRIAEGDVAQMRVGLPREVAMYLLNQKRDDLAVLESRYDARIQVVISDRLMPHESEIEARTREPGERLPPVARAGGLAPADLPAPVNGARRSEVERAASAYRPGAAAAGTPRARATARPVEGATNPRADDTEAGQRRRRRRGGRSRREGAAAEHVRPEAFAASEKVDSSAQEGSGRVPPAALRAPVEAPEAHAGERYAPAESPDVQPGERYAPAEPPDVQTSERHPSPEPADAQADERHARIDFVADEPRGMRPDFADDPVKNVESEWSRQSRAADAPVADAQGLGVGDLSSSAAASPGDAERTREELAVPRGAYTVDRAVSDYAPATGTAAMESLAADDAATDAPVGTVPTGTVATEGASSAPATNDAPATTDVPGPGRRRRRRGGRRGGRGRRSTADRTAGAPDVAAEGGSSETQSSTTEDGGSASGASERAPGSLESGAAAGRPRTHQRRRRGGARRRRPRQAGAIAGSSAAGAAESAPPVAESGPAEPPPRS